MLAVLSSLFINNFKYIMYAVVALAIVMLAYKLYDTIRENGANKIVIEQQEAAIRAQKQFIDNLNKDIKLKEDVIQERDDELQALNERLENITDNLGVDEGDDAAESLKELFRRLGRQ